MGVPSRKPLLPAVVVLLVACASGSPDAGSGGTRGAVPDLRGARVLVLPTQILEGVRPDLTVDEELAFALRTRTQRVSWIFRAEVEAALRRSPNVQASLADLPVGIFLQAEVNRIGDPLYGEIRRLTTIVGADIAVIPVLLTYGEDGAYHLVSALLEPTSGRVLWVTTVDGEAGPPDDPGTLASLADALARALAPLG
jgi:hypothetical protein